MLVMSLSILMFKNIIFFNSDEMNCLIVQALLKIYIVIKVALCNSINT